MEAMAYDIRVREGPVLKRENLIPSVVEIEEDWNTSGKDWQLSAFRVEHMPVDQAFGFRIDQGGSSIVISGDTKECENLVRHAKDTDILVHEVFPAQNMRDLAANAPDAEERARFELLSTYHTSSEEVGKVADRANAKHLVLSHYVRAQPEIDFSGDITADYGGKLTAGEDLMTFEV